MDVINLLNTIAAYGFATVPLMIFVVWTIWGNWYTYDLGWMIMVLDLGLWMLDAPSLAHRIIHLNVATEGWKWYYVFAEYLILAMMIWRGWLVIATLFRKGESDDQRELRD